MWALNAAAADGSNSDVAASAACDSDLSSEEEELSNTDLIIKSIIGNHTYDTTEDVSRHIYYIEEALQSNSSTCLICMSTVKRKDAIWSCEQCYTFFHITCIQRWAYDTFARLESDENASSPMPPLPTWNCPKCRLAFTKKQIPQRYHCFCGAEANPEPQEFLMPHSCGGLCKKPLSSNCGHECLLLCHPGPCHPCSVTVYAACYCKRQVIYVRCSKRMWSCEGECARRLPCGRHSCARPCHAGDCPLCEVLVTQRCLCGDQEKPVACVDSAWSCDKRCGKELTCGYHLCEEVCHAPGGCPPCPDSGVKSCPCGSVTADVQCPKRNPLCQNTCNKPLPLCVHTCSAKCHYGECPPCVLVVAKLCQCGGSGKMHACSKELRCQTKCQRSPCGQHKCSRRCCVQCPPCDRVCGKWLRCNKHKCPAVCHPRQLCYPCPVENKVSCPCTGTFVMTKCGQKHARVPVCKLPCKKKYACGHETGNIHKCHKGDCPPCQMPCGNIMQCGHECRAPCHKYVQIVMAQTAAPVTPSDIQPPKVITVHKECPPCCEPVTLQCEGGHPRRTVKCHSASSVVCEMPCGKRRNCKRHLCVDPCHLGGPPCEPCKERCSLLRPRHCRHTCPADSCHPGECPTCTLLVRPRCYCSRVELALTCDQLTDPDILRCNQRCTKSMSCGHRCLLKCHPGDCSNSEDCTKLVKVVCPCHTSKQEIKCCEKESLVAECGEACERKKAEEAEQAKRKEEFDLQAEEERSRRELEQYERMFNKRGRRRRERAAPPPPASSRAAAPLVYLAAAAVIFAAAIAYLLLDQNLYT